MAHVKLEGSEKHSLPGAKEIGPANPSEQIEVTLLLRRVNVDLLKDHLSRLRKGERFARHFSREDVAYHFSASPDDISLVRDFAYANGLEISKVERARRSVMLNGSVEAFCKAFKVDLKNFEHNGNVFRGRVGDIQIPEELKEAVQAVLGLDNRPQAKPHFRRLKPKSENETDTKIEPHLAPKFTSGSFTPVQLAQLYDFPKGDGSGQCIAIIELGGGFTTSDLFTYFGNLGITTPPIVTSIPVDNGSNAPDGNPDSADGEVMLDIEVAGAIAPGAHIAVYFAPNTDAGFINAVTQAAHDLDNKPSVISISWGSSENNWTQQSMKALDEAIQIANSMGVTVCVASGDNGSSDGENDGQDHVDFPASSPNALGCGGTNIQSSNGTITSETVWNDGADGGAGGGGMSVAFPVPAWQEGLQANKNFSNVALTGRGVPDVCGNADPQTGYQVRVDGQDTVVGGTSAVAPLWAGLIARINALLGRNVGFLNPILYKNPSALNDIISGNNGNFSATPGWDACSGLGSPKGSAIVDLLPPKKEGV